jgi:glycosyltransferase involved in cell wall biosynthesis
MGQRCGRVEGATPGAVAPASEYQWCVQKSHLQLRSWDFLVFTLLSSGVHGFIQLLEGNLRSDRLALFVPSMRGGGAERVMLELAHGFASRGIPTDLVLPQMEGPYLSHVRPDVRLVDLRASRVLSSLPGLVGYLRRERPIALLSTLTHVNLVALWARRIARVETRIVIREANTLSVGKAGSARNRVLPLLARQYYRRADEVVAVSEGVASDLIATAGLAPERVHVLYNPIVTRELQQLAQAAVDHPWFAAGSPPVVLAAGRLSRQKDFPVLIRAFAARQTRSARLLILGEGPERPALEALVGSLGAASEIALPGFVANPFAYMARAAVFVLSSAWEGMPGVLIQALACGAPAVATDCESGPREVLQNGRVGRLVPVGDVSGLAQAIDATLAEPRRPLPHGVLDRFTQESAVTAYLRVLQRNDRVS